MPDIKLSIIVEERLVYVWLDDVGEGLPVLVLPFSSQQCIDRTELGQYNSVAPVAVLPRFYDPHFVLFILVLSYEVSICLLLHWFDMVGFRNIIKRVLIFNPLVVIVHRFEQILFRADAIIVRNVVCYYIWGVLIEDDCVPVFEDVSLNPHTHIQGKYFTI